MSFGLYLLAGIIPIFFANKRLKAVSAILSIAYLVPIFLFAAGIIPDFSSTKYSWLPSYGIYFSFSLDGLAKLFLLLISGIGILVFAYAISYFHNKWDKLNRLLALLQIFTLSMIGLISSDNMITIFLFWELTTLSSYFLVKFDYADKEARKAAFNGIFITVFGAIAMLIGFVMLGDIFSTFSIHKILYNLSTTSILNQHFAYFAVAFILIFFGAITKSAQFPFQFWLTGAMKAPTPVSAFLHSATMVNAGVYILARIHPLFAHNFYWYPVLLYVGLLTCFISAVMALLQKDLKAILAYTTIYSLGMMFTLLASSDSSIIQALCAFIFIHALYKASLFMLAGIIDKRNNTRDITNLKGAVSHSKTLKTITIISCLSMAGMPPFFSFVVKNFIYDAKIGSDHFSLVIIAIGVFSAACISAVSFRLMFTLISPNKNHTEKTPWAMPAANIIPFTLAISIIIATLMPNMLDKYFFVSASLSILADKHNIISPLFNWRHILTGYSSTLFVLVTLFIGYLIYIFHEKVIYIIKKIKFTSIVDSQSMFEKFFKRVIFLSKTITSNTQEKQLSFHLKIYFFMFCAVFLATIGKMHNLGFPNLQEITSGISMPIILFSILIIISILIVVFTSEFLVIMISLGVSGLAISCVYLYYGALDVAMTQLLVEALTVIIIALSFRNSDLKKQLSSLKKNKQILNIILSIFVGLIVMFILVIIVYKPFDFSVSNYFIKNAPLAFGKNVVNVILVDFRVFDTFGEASVVFGTAIATWVLFQAYENKKNKEPKTKQHRVFKSVILSAIAKIILQIMLIISVLLVTQGHNYPGGGFIGSLVAISGVALCVFARKILTDKLAAYSPFIIAFGFVLFVVSMTVPLLLSNPIFTGTWQKVIFLNQTVKIGTPVAFDFGVYFIIIGSISWIIAKIEDRQI